MTQACPLLESFLEAPFSIFRVHLIGLNHVTWPPLATGEAGRCFLSWAHCHPKLSQVVTGGEGAAAESATAETWERSLISICL